MKRKQARWKPGMTYAVPLADGSFGLAQTGDAMMVNIVYVALFSERLRELPEQSPQLTTNTAIALTATWRQALNRGEWPSLGIAPQVFLRNDFPNEQFAPVGYVGAKHCDAPLLSKFLSAYHGLMPWNAMNEETYFDTLLLPGVARPKTVVLLSGSERERYRRENFGVNA